MEAIQMQTETKSEVTIEAVIIRKDGRRIDLGVIASTKNNTVNASKRFTDKLKGICGHENNRR
jgi:hypothetical protein